MDSIARIKELYNQPLDPNWDNVSIDYDLQKYNWNEIFLNLAKELKPEITNLQDLHKHFDITELLDLRKHYEKYANSTEFASMVDSFIEDYVVDKIPSKDYLVQRTTGIRLVIPDQAKHGRLLSFHTGYWTGYDNHMYTTWIPVTDTWDSNSMQVIGWDKTKELIDEIYAKQLPAEEIDALCESVCWPVNVKVGSAWQFNQGHLHGNINNDTGVSRVSFDVRVATPQSDFEHRRPGSFYRLPGESTEANFTKLKPEGSWLVFTDQNSRFVYPTPHYMIREFMLGYARSHGLNPVEWVNDYYITDWMPKFDDLTKQNIQGIVLPSVFAFSVDNERVLEFLTQGINHGMQFLFADENLVVDTVEDLDHIRKLYYFMEKPSE